MTVRTIKDPVVPWSGKGHLYNNEEIELVSRLMREADPLTQGQHQREFEKRFREYVGSRHAFAVSSCSSALQLSAVLTRLGPDDEVIIPAHTFTATAIPFATTGARIVWADIDPGTRVISIDSTRKYLSPRTKVIVVVHLYGLMADMDPIMDLARDNGLYVVEDAAQAIGASYHGRRAGSIGHLGCFSFHTHKNITTLGEGGMLTVNRDEWAEVVPGFRHYGMRAFPESRQRYWVPTMTNVDFDWDGIWPYNFCLGEVQCALGARMLERVEQMNEDRRARATRVREALSSYAELSFQHVPDGCVHSYHLLAARYDGSESGRTRDDFIETIAFKHGVQAVVQYYPLYRYPMFQKAGFGDADCPNTDDFYDNMVSFPFHHWLSEEQIEYMIGAIRATVEELRG